MAQAVAGPFANNGITPAGIAVGKVARIEGTRAVLRHLESQDLGLGIEWDDLGPVQREALVHALYTVLCQAEKAAAKLATAELAAYEERALEIPCPACQAEEGEKCRDLRRLYDLVPVKHPHQARLDFVTE